VRFSEPFRYEVEILNPNKGKLFEITGSDGRPNFRSPVTSRLPKLYVVSTKFSKVPIYVGITSQSMRTRLRLGWTATGATGYYGYHWRHKYERVTLDVWCHEDPDKLNPRQDVETVEAEVVFLIRQNGQWPSDQTEIHFHPSEERHRREARRIVGHYFP
jgi:hypothetical protein